MESKQIKIGRPFSINKRVNKSFTISTKANELLKELEETLQDSASRILDEAIFEYHKKTKEWAELDTFMEGMAESVFLKNPQLAQFIKEKKD